MLNLYSLSDNFFGFSSLFLNIILILCFLAGILTIISKNPILSVVYLIILFSGISCYLILIGIKFIGISYLLVYVGAVSILFLFILMLINIRISELSNDTSNHIPLAILTIIAFFIPLNDLLPNSYNNKSEINNIFSPVTENILKYVSSNDWENNIVEIYDITSIGNTMYTNYSLWLIITSIILLLAMVGSIVITIKQKY